MNVEQKEQTQKRPYDSLDELPEAVKKLPKHAQEIWMAAFNAAYEEYDGDEEKAFAVAWAAVKKAGYDVGGKKSQKIHHRIIHRGEILDYNDETRKITAVLSTPVVPEDGLSLVPEGVRVRSPDGTVPLLWMHGLDVIRGSVPIGCVKNIRVEEVRLPDYEGRAVVGDKFYYDPSPEVQNSALAEFAKVIYDMRKQGLIKAVSIGFEVDEVYPSEEGNHLIVPSWRLYEVSDCAVGADPNALDVVLARVLPIDKTRQAAPKLRDLTTLDILYILSQHIPAQGQKKEKEK